MLDKLSQVLPNGTFVSELSNENRFALSVGSLSMTRMTMLAGSARLGVIVSQIALRYSCVRKQFGKGDEEQALIEYPL